MQERMVKPEKIFKSLFNAGFYDRKVKKQVVFPLAKEKYAEYLLTRHWQEICGEHLAKYCCVQKINGSELVIGAANSLLANELFMMKELFLQKVNSQLMGRVFIKKISFQVGTNIKKYDRLQKEAASTEEETAPKNYNTPCAKCGVIVQADAALCDVCAREEKNILKYKIAELLNVQPWLQYKECLQYYQCDSILFTAVKDGLKNTYFERVRLNKASEYDCQMAVMLLTGKPPEEIDEKIYENSLAYLRRNQNVLTSRLGLYGKK